MSSPLQPDSAFPKILAQLAVRRQAASSIPTSCSKLWNQLPGTTHPSTAVGPSALSGWGMLPEPGVWIWAGLGKSPFGSLIALCAKPLLAALLRRGWRCAPGPLCGRVLCRRGWGCREWCESTGSGDARGQEQHFGEQRSPFPPGAWAPEVGCCPAEMNLRTGSTEFIISFLSLLVTWKGNWVIHQLPSPELLSGAAQLSLMLFAAPCCLCWLNTEQSRVKTPQQKSPFCVSCSFFPRALCPFAFALRGSQTARSGRSAYGNSSFKM